MSFDIPASLAKFKYMQSYIEFHLNNMLISYILKEDYQ